ncbi:hypothetical protein [Roseicyclus sp.]|uniref:hypothetical protein n=1 Tax=Roseicyclus sp. TaxID=1914329 RepID=UPI003F6C3FA9
MNSDSFLDQDLRSALRAEAQISALRPSVIRSEFFRDYSLKRILEAPDAAWFDLLHTRGVGGKSTNAIAQVVSQELADRFPQEWATAQALAVSDGDAAANAPWPVAALVQFIQVWMTPATH